MSKILDVIRRNLYSRNTVSAFDCDSVVCQCIFPAEKFGIPAHTDARGNTHESFPSYGIDVPPLYVFSIDRGRCVLGSESVFTKDNEAISEVRADRQTDYRRYLKRPSWPIRVPESVAVLSVGGIESNYYHFNVEFLSRLHILEKSGLKPDLYIVPTTQRFQREFLSIAGIDESRILSFPKGTFIESSRLIVPSLINNSRDVLFRGQRYAQKKWLPSWIGEVYDKYKVAPHGPRRRIYISRRNATVRRLVNESEIMDLLGRHGFEECCLEDRGVSEQIELFSSAEAIVAPHGAGLANMAYSPKGTVILELFPQWYHEAGNRLLSYMLGHDYNYIIGSTPKTDRILPQVEDICIDPRDVEILLKSKGM